LIDYRSGLGAPNQLGLSSARNWPWFSRPRAAFATQRKRPSELDPDLHPPPPSSASPLFLSRVMNDGSP